MRDLVAKHAGELVVQGPVSLERCDSTHGVWIAAFGEVKVIYKRLVDHNAQAFSHESTYLLQQSLSQCGLAAKPLWFDKNQNVWIEAYLPAEDMTKYSQAPSREIGLLTHALVNLHQVRAGDGDIRELDPFKQCEYLLEQLNTTKAVILKNKLRLLHAEVQSSEHANEPWVLCHNDLHLAHVRAEKRCVDWEYAGIGPRYFDVAMCMTINQISVSSQQKFIDEYAQLAGTDSTYVHQQVACYLRLCTIINDTWLQVLQQNT